jgi:hypothetical protein
MPAGFVGLAGFGGCFLVVLFGLDEVGGIAQLLSQQNIRCDSVWMQPEAIDGNRLRALGSVSSPQVFRSGKSRTPEIA